MLQDLDYLSMLMINFLIVGAWHGITYLFSSRMPLSSFRPDAIFYRQRRWEKDGRWYRDHLHITEWKDRMPQFIRKDGFSKRHLAGTSVKYLDQFIRETCRGEWMHAWNLGCIFVILAANQSIVGVTFSVLVFFGNSPFAIIQRYNRFRLELIRKRLCRVATPAVIAT
ncbi:MAG: hypothetical protein PHE09_18100 [Oscillospiraceae bacterium]|nr:hypothetical protein [Oscillospiraceae bacterium]